MGLIIIITIVLCIGLWVVFRKANHRIVEYASLEHKELKQQIATQNAQITTRQIHLDRYHFLRYNLQEALQPQPEIKI